MFIGNMCWKLMGKLLYNICIYKRGIYIKIGQILSNQYASFPKSFILEMKRLQHDIPCYLVESEIEDIKSTIDSNITDIKLVEAGSVAVIFKGVYKNNNVAIKVIKPDIKKLFDSQCKTIEFLLRLIPSYYNGLNIDKKWNHVKKTLLLQLDIEKEIYYANIFHKTCKYVKTPMVYNELSTNNVMVMEWIDGCLLTNIETIDICDEAKKELGSNLAMFLKESHDIGKIHMDLHPGNIIITNDKRLAILDFGLMFDIDIKQSKLLFKLISYLFKREHKQFVDTFFEIYIKTENDNLKQNIEYTLELFGPNLSQNPYKFLKEVYRLCEDEGVYIDHTLADFELAMFTSKDTFFNLWEMSNDEFYMLIT